MKKNATAMTKSQDAAAETAIVNKMEDENMNENEEMEDVEVWEVSLTREEIQELAGNLNKLLETKGNFEFDLDDENVLSINYEEENE